MLTYICMNAGSLRQLPRVHPEPSANTTPWGNYCFVVNFVWSLRLSSLLFFRHCLQVNRESPMCFNRRSCSFSLCLCLCRSFVSWHVFGLIDSCLRFDWHSLCYNWQVSGLINSCLAIDWHSLCSNWQVFGLIDSCLQFDWHPLLLQLTGVWFARERWHNKEPARNSTALWRNSPHTTTAGRKCDYLFERQRWRMMLLQWFSWRILHVRTEWKTLKSVVIYWPF